MQLMQNMMKLNAGQTEGGEKKHWINKLNNMNIDELKNELRGPDFFRRDTREYDGGARKTKVKAD